MYISQIWRYPVKSMGGEELKHATIGPLGIVGDRVVHVEDAHGRFITSRTHPRLLGHRASLDSSDEPTVDGLRWTDPHVLQIAEGIVGTGARLVRDDSAGRFDILPLLIGTDGAIAAFGHDGSRLRPNIIIGGVDGMAERSWPHHCLNIGNVRIGVADLRTRCVMTTFDPDTLQQNRGVPREIVRKFGGKLALNCYVRGGRSMWVTRSTWSRVVNRKKSLPVKNRHHAGQRTHHLVPERKITYRHIPLGRFRGTVPQVFGLPSRNYSHLL